jgi:hypothetical protein
MAGWSWKLNRLRAMGVGEVLYRGRQFTQVRLERCGLGCAVSSAPAGATGKPWVAPLPVDFERARYIEAADRVLAGQFDVFTLKGVSLGFPPRWNRDPRTGIDAPLSFGKTLDYRDERIVGDIKYLWEPNRHAGLVTLAQAWHLTRDGRYAAGCQRLLESWFEECPYPLGPNWTSSLEHAVRLANWAVAWHLLGEGSIRDTDARFRIRWLDSVYRHCHFIAGHHSRHSSANNHLLGELMGLVIGATVWPLWPESARWRMSAAQEFEAEALKQNAEDGVNREQALWYQHEVADMMLLAGLFGRANGMEFSAVFWERLERMLEFICAVMDAGGHVPMMGDADDGRLVGFAEVDVYRSLLATGSVLFGRGDFKAKAGAFDDKSRWLLGDLSASAFDRVVAKPLAAPRRDFPSGGYSILGDRWGTPEEIRIVADAGPLGYLSIAAHGHADALAFTLSVGGEEVLIDPGTYVYQAQPVWRDYFRGTSAHNTVRVDDCDQSVSGGAFLWVRHAQARCERFDTGQEKEIWVGRHEGYLRLRDPVRHRRVLEFDKSTRQLRVIDRLECHSRHRIEVFWHAHEACDVELVGNDLRLRRGPAQVGLRMPAMGWQPRLVRGQETPPLGWVSRRFDQKSPCATAVWAGEIDGSAELVTLISIGLAEDAT